MDANRFDALAKALSLSAARRSYLAGLLGGGVTSVLASLEAAARRRAGRHTHRDDDLSAEKRKKKKCKKCGPCRRCKKGKCKAKPNGTVCSGGSCQSGVCKPGDQAPPCTDQSCPLPPECSQPVLDDCTEALFEAWLAAAEPCELDCQEPSSAACQACLEPIITARLPEAEACVAESCDSAASATANRRASRVSPREWWPRSCENVTCCYVSLRDCENDAAEAFFECAGLALAGALASPIGGAGGLAFCIGKLVYFSQKCRARYGCQDVQTCFPGDRCCPAGSIACEDECCNLASETCCGGGCCNEPNAQCCLSTGEDPFFYCCPSNRTCCSTGGNQCCLS